MSITIPALTAVAKIMHPFTSKYSFGFENNTLDSWTGGSGGSFGASVFTTVPHRGSYVGVMDTINGTVNRTRSITGLTIGRSYIFSAWVSPLANAYTAGVLYSVGVTGIGYCTGVRGLPGGGKWSRVWYRFTATATSHTFELRATGPSIQTVHWDDIALVELEYQVGADITLGVLPGSSITLDERRAPYGEATLRIALPSQSDLDLLDTRTTNTIRIQMTAGVTLVTPAGSPQSRVFDLLLHERGADFTADSTSVTLICRSDEAILVDAGNDTASDDTSLTLDQRSLRGIIDAMLETHGAALEPGTVDADFRVTTNLTNQIANPSAETNVTGWIASSAQSTVTRSTAQSVFDLASIGVTATGSGNVGALYGTSTSGSGATLAVTAGTTVTASAFARVGVARNATLTIRFFDASSTQVGSDVSTASTALSTTAWTWMQVSTLVPATATKAFIFLAMASAVSGNTLYIDGVMFGAYSDTKLTYFDGSTTADAYYTYGWDGTANNSTSHRTRLDTRDPQLLNQTPGEKDWDVLAQIVQVAGLRLFCDETRAWRLVDPATYIPAGTAALEGAVRGRDLISRESGDWCDAVVVKYTWIGTDGLQKVQYDAATAGGTCVLLVEWDRPYPGPGAAAAILARYQGRGRVQELVTPFDLTATPGMALTTDLPNTPAQTGYVSKVTWAVGEEFSTTVDARGLVNA